MVTLPPHLVRAHEVDRSFHADARCRAVDGTPDGTPKLAWTAEVKRRYELGSQTYTGHKLILMALEVCRGCPVQWRCTEAAIEGDEPVGTWGARIEDVRWLGRRKNWRRELAAAASEEVPVQQFVQMLRAR